MWLMHTGTIRFEPTCTPCDVSIPRIRLESEYLWLEDTSFGIIYVKNQHEEVT